MTGISDSSTNPTAGADTDAEPDPSVMGEADSPRDDGLPGQSPESRFSELPTPTLPSHLAGASVYTPNSAPQGDALNPRSCVTCRRRKVRCDKRMPCSNCRRAQIPCIFPAPGRAPRRPRPKDPNAPPKPPSSEREIELMKRLRKLEGIVEELSGQIELEATKHHSPTGGSPDYSSATPSGDARACAPNGTALRRAQSVTSAHSSPAIMHEPLREVDGSHAHSVVKGYGPLKPTTPVDARKQFGRLVIGHHGSARYVSSAFWSKINDELDELRSETLRLSGDDSDGSDGEGSTPATHAERSSADHHAFIFGYRSSDVDLRSLHPLPSQIPFIWAVYKENVDPVIKVLHVPSLDKTIRDVVRNLDHLTPPIEALMFSIYFGAVNSIDEEDVQKTFGTQKSILLSQYRFAMEQALSKAQFLTNCDFTTLQAFVIFLVIVRRHDDTRFAWTLTGLAIRLSQSLGLHRDGSNFANLTPFQIEMRRRLFWALLVIDLRAAEDQGTDLTIIDSTWDTQLPLNVNDADLYPDMKELPKPRLGHTDIAFTLVRYEIHAVARQLYTITSAAVNPCPTLDDSTLEERERMLVDVAKRVESKYLSGYSLNNPLHWLTGSIARIIIAKMTLTLYQPVLFRGPGEGELSDDARWRLFMSALEILEYSHTLNADPRCHNFRWLFQTYLQWHPSAFLLMEMFKRPWSSTCERAWVALWAIFKNPQPDELERIAEHTAVWLPFKKLYFKVKKWREAEIERLRNDPQAAQQLLLEEMSKDAPTSFAGVPSSVMSTMAQERWRKLVNAPPLPPELQAQMQGQSEAATDPYGGRITSRPAESHTSGPRTGPLNSPAPPISAQAVELMDSIMAQPTFEPLLMLPVAWSPEMNSADLARTAIFGSIGSGDMPSQDITLGSFARNSHNQGQAQQQQTQPPTQNQNQAQSQAQKQGQGQAQGLGQGTPLVDAMKKEYPPPWLWTQPPYPEINRFAEVQLEDMDINMDDDFNWQNFGESIRGFEMDGGTPGVWGTHGI